MPHPKENLTKNGTVQNILARSSAQNCASQNLLISNSVFSSFHQISQISLKCSKDISMTDNLFSARKKILLVLRFIFTVIYMNQKCKNESLRNTIMSKKRMMDSNGLQTKNGKYLVISIKVSVYLYLVFHVFLILAI